MRALLLVLMLGACTGGAPEPDPPPTPYQGSVEAARAVEADLERGQARLEEAARQATDTLPER